MSTTISSDATTPGAFAPQAACNYISVGRSTLYELIKAGEISVIKVGRRTIIARSELDDFLLRRGAGGSVSHH